MKKLLWNGLLLLSSLVATAQDMVATDEVQEDSLVQVIGWFCKTDTLEYRYSQVIGEIVNGDTTVVDGSGCDFCICVNDSTKKGYTMTYMTTDVWKNDSLSPSGRLALMASRSALGSKVIFTTDELGSFREIVNWKERYKAGLDMQKKLIDQTFYQHPELYARQSKQDLMKRLKEQYDEEAGTKEKMTKLFVPLTLLFTFHGIQLPVGETNVETANKIQHYQVTKGALEDEESSDESEYQIYSEIESKESDLSTTHYFYKYAYFADGWPRSVMATVVEQKTDKTVVTQLAIEWLSKSW